MVYRTINGKRLVITTPPFYPNGANNFIVVLYKFSFQIFNFIVEYEGFLPILIFTLLFYFVFLSILGIHGFTQNTTSYTNQVVKSSYPMSNSPLSYELFAPFLTILYFRNTCAEHSLVASHTNSPPPFPRLKLRDDSYCRGKSILSL